MGLELGSPAVLFLLLIVPAVWLVAATIGLPARRRPVFAIVRGVTLACLVGALSQPVLSVRASRVSVICLVDVSHSVSSGAIHEAAAAIDEVRTTLRPDALRILAFGARTSPMPDADALRRLSTPAAREDLERLVSPEATNLEQALAAARAEIPPGTNARILLFSDGHDTEGDSRRLADRLAADHVPVFTRVMAVRDLRDMWIDAIRLPRAAMAESVTTLEVILGSQIVRPVDLTVREGSQVLARRRVEVGLGATTTPIEVRFATPGPHLVEAVITPETPGDDAIDVNNRLMIEVLVEPRPRVLFVHADAGTVPVAARILAEAGFQITDAQPKALPIAPEAYDGWDVVLLSNLARPLLSEPAMRAMATWVEERGGGVLFVGGPAIVTEGAAQDRPDYRDTDIERVLPVTFEREDEPDVALVIVLDRSWSMNGVAMELSKTAAEAAAMTLAPSHMVGVLTFNNQATWDVPLARLRESRGTLADAIRRITASGPTDIFLALSQAYEALVGLRARAKHLILLSDGQTEAADFEGLMRKMTEARVTVSTVALGADADVTLLRNIGTWGGGRSYAVLDARQVPEIFVKEAKNAASQKGDEQDGIRPVRGVADLMRGDGGDLPMLQAHNAVTRKPGAIDLLLTTRGEPLLALWPAGLGRTAMFAADIDGRWTREWLPWRGFAALLGNVVRSLAARPRPARALQVLAGDRAGALRTLTVALEARDGEGRAENFLAPLIDIQAPNRPAERLALPQVAPGRYESQVIVDASDPLTFRFVDRQAPEPVARILTVDHAAEYRFGEPDERRLTELASITGGRPNATAKDLAGVARASQAQRHALAPWLLVAALLGWLGDVAVRRLVR